MSFSLSKDLLSIHVGDVLEDPTKTITEIMAWFGWKVAKTIWAPTLDTVEGTFIGKGKG